MIRNLRSSLSCNIRDEWRRKKYTGDVRFTQRPHFQSIHFIHISFIRYYKIL